MTFARTALCWAMLFNLFGTPIVAAIFRRDRRIEDWFAKYLGIRLAAFAYICFSPFTVLIEEALIGKTIVHAEQNLLKLTTFDDDFKNLDQNVRNELAKTPFILDSQKLCTG